MTIIYMIDQATPNSPGDILAKFGNKLCLASQQKTRYTS